MSRQDAESIRPSHGRTNTRIFYNQRFVRRAFDVTKDERVFPSDNGFSVQVTEKIRPQSPVGIMEITVANELDMDPQDLTGPEMALVISIATSRRRLQEFLSNKIATSPDTSDLYF